jgi:mannose-6-phosphate isomerase-like protein (cupin superfamily)
MRAEQNKLQKHISIIMFLAADIVFTGCGTENNCQTKVSPQFLSLRLNQQPEYQPLLTGRPLTCGMRSGRVYLKPSEDCGSHSTKNNEEMLTFLSGTGTALMGEDQVPHEVSKDSIIYIPPHTVHNMKNTGTEPLVYIYCVAPADDRHEKPHAEEDHHH